MAVIRDPETWRMAVRFRCKLQAAALSTAIDHARVAHHAGDQGGFSLWVEIARVIRELERKRRDDDSVH
jgi:hypothetical protein